MKTLLTSFALILSFALAPSLASAANGKAACGKARGLCLQAAGLERAACQQACREIEDGDSRTACRDECRDQHRFDRDECRAEREGCVAMVEESDEGGGRACPGTCGHEVRDCTHAARDEHAGCRTDCKEEYRAARDLCKEEFADDDEARDACLADAKQAKGECLAGCAEARAEAQGSCASGVLACVETCLDDLPGPPSDAGSVVTPGGPLSEPEPLLN